MSPRPIFLQRKSRFPDLVVALALGLLAGAVLGLFI